MDGWARCLTTIYHFAIPMHMLLGCSDPKSCFRMQTTREAVSDCCTVRPEIRLD